MSSKQDDVSIWLPIYIGEMLAMTARFSTEQIGALYLLMMDYWKNGAYHTIIKSLLPSLDCQLLRPKPLLSCF